MLGPLSVRFSNRAGSRRRSRSSTTRTESTCLEAYGKACRELSTTSKPPIVTALKALRSSSVGGDGDGGDGGDDGQEDAERFVLAGCHLGVRDVAALAKGLGMASCLTVLDLSRCPVGNEGSKHLAQRIGTAYRLRRLCLASCSIGDEGGVAIANALGDAPPPGSPLAELDLSSNSCSVSFAEALGSALVKVGGAS